MPRWTQIPRRRVLNGSDVADWALVAPRAENGTVSKISNETVSKIRRTHPMFFSDVSCASYSRCTLNSSSALVARAAISKIQSRSLSSSDFPVRTRPERHRRCPPFELFSTQHSFDETIQHGPQKLTGNVKKFADFRNGPFFRHEQSQF